MMRAKGMGEKEIAFARTLFSQPAEDPLAPYPAGAVVATVQVKCGLRDKYVFKSLSFQRKMNSGDGSAAPASSASTTTATTTATTTGTTTGTATTAATTASSPTSTTTTTTNDATGNAARASATSTTKFEAKLLSEEIASVKEVTYTFRGCISGQVPLQWTLVHMNSKVVKNVQK